MLEFVLTFVMPIAALTLIANVAGVGFDARKGKHLLGNEYDFSFSEPRSDSIGDSNGSLMPLSSCDLGSSNTK